MSARRNGAVPLFVVGGQARRILPALERTFTELRRLDVDAGPNGHAYRALARTLAETIDDRGASLHSMATAAGQIVVLVRLLAGDDPSSATFEDIRAALSAPPRDAEG